MTHHDPTGAGRRAHRLVRPAGRLGAAVAVAVAVASSTLVLTAPAASAAVPAFPDNLVVFPDRDFVTVEGFQDHVGEVATLEVTRGGTVVGSAKSVIAAGDVAFEVNHPGGACWGAGTGLAVTPDIVPGDRVSLRFPDGSNADTVVQDASVTQDGQLSGSTLVLTGRIAPGVSSSQTEQRIVNPDLTGTAVARRDVRALPGGLVRAPRGGYSSSLTFDAGTFTATYVFDDPAVAAIAAGGGGARMMAWQEEDADGNRQGLSIAERGESGGPGMGGCPNGPGSQAAPAASFSGVRSADGTQLQVNWTPAAALPGSAAVTGYSVAAIAAGDAQAVRPQAGMRTGSTGNRASITGLTPGTAYTVEVRSLAGARMSEPFTAVATPPVGPVDETTPRLVMTPAPSATPGVAVQTDQVTLSSDAGADLYYAIGTAAVTGDLPSDEARLYTGPIPVKQKIELHVAAFDRTGNVETAIGTFAPGPVDEVVVPAAPTNVAATADQQTAMLTWAADPSATSWSVQPYIAGVRTGNPTVTTAPRATLAGLQPSTSYTFGVVATNSAGSSPETMSPAARTTALVDRVTIASARWKAGDFRVNGTSTGIGAVVSVRSGSATGPVLGTANVTAAAPPATGGEYSLRLRNAAAGTRNPGQIWVTSNGGGVAGPFTVSNG